MLAAVKALLYLGAVLLLGAGVFGRFVGYPLGTPGSPLRSRRLLWGSLAGALVLIVASLLDVLLTIRTTLGFIEPSLVAEYLGSTRHGRAVQLRLALIVLGSVLALAGGRHPRAWYRAATGAAFVVSGIGLLLTFSWLSHAAVMQGTLPLVADLVHFCAAAAWGGSLLYLALSPVWSPAAPGLGSAVVRLSATGLAAVAALAATGTYAGLLHIWRPDLLTGSPYGRILVLKVVLVTLIVGIAAANRLWLLPALKEAPEGAATGRLGVFVRAEAVLLVLVLATTGALSTSPLPHP